MWNSSVMDTKTTVDCDNCTGCIAEAPERNIYIPIATSLLGIIGNAIALWTIRNSRKEHHRTVFFVLVGGLAWTDLIGIIFTTPPVLIGYFYGGWQGGVAMCNYHAFSMITFGMITPLIVCSMAIERCLGIRHGYFYTRHLNTSKAKHLLLVLWLFTVLFSSLPFFGFGRYAVQYPETWCFLNIHPDKNGNILDSAYSVTFAMLNLFLIIIIIVCNIVVQCTLIVMRWQRTKMGSPTQFRRTHRSRKQQELEIQMVVLLLAITIVFTCCWAPLMIQILVNQVIEHHTCKDHAADILAVRLATINQVLDPWVYILCRKIFFTRLWTCWKTAILGKGSQRGPSGNKRISLSNQGNGSRQGTQKKSPEGEPFVIPPTELQVLKIYPENGHMRIMNMEDDKHDGRGGSRVAPLVSSEVDISFRDSGTSSIDERSRAPTTPNSRRHSSSINNSSVISFSSNIMKMTIWPHRLSPLKVRESHTQTDDKTDKREVCPIPVFGASRYCIRKSSRRKDFRRGDREYSSSPRRREPRTSSISESVETNHRCNDDEEEDVFHSCAGDHVWLRSNRRHSLGCLDEGLDYTHVRTRSTQTINSEKPETRVEDRV